MLESELLNAIEKQYTLVPSLKRELIDFLSGLKVGDLIYPGHLKNTVNLDIKNVYQMLELLKTQGYISVIYEIYCHDCNHASGIFLDSISEFDPECCCEFCGHRLSALDDIRVLYKLLR